MSEEFFKRPILNSPYEYPGRHWELDDDGQPTNRILDYRRSPKFVTPVPKPRKRKEKKGSGYRQAALAMRGRRDDGRAPVRHDLDGQFHPREC